MGPFFTERDGRLTQYVLTERSRYVIVCDMSTLTQAVEVAGGVGKLAAAIGVAQNVVSNWRKRGKVPAEHVLAIEAATGVSRHLLRPDVFGPPAANDDQQEAA